MRQRTANALIIRILKAKSNAHQSETNKDIRNMININELQTWLKACVGGADLMTMGLLCHLIITSDFTGDRLTQLPSLEFETGFSKNKLHRRLKALEERGAITRTKFHRRGIGIKIKECSLIGNSTRNANETQSETRQNSNETLGIFLKNILQQAVNQGVAEMIGNKNILKENINPQPIGTQSETKTQPMRDDDVSCHQTVCDGYCESSFQSAIECEMNGMNDDLYKDGIDNYIYKSDEMSDFVPQNNSNATPPSCACARPIVTHTGINNNINNINKYKNMCISLPEGNGYRLTRMGACAREGLSVNATTDPDIPTEPYSSPKEPQWHPVVVPFPSKAKDVIDAATMRGIAMKEDEAQAFIDYNEAKGWMISGSRIMDWRKLLPSWKKQQDEKELRRKSYAGYANNSRWDNKVVGHDGEFGESEEIA